MNGQQAAPAYRIYQGDTVLGVVWSNAAVNMDAWVRVVYDDGSSETLRMDRFVTGSARAAQLISTIQTAKHDGYVTEGLVFSDAPQRGQTYVVLYVSQGYNPGDVRMALCKGYVYASTPLAVGQQVEPGPSGGYGNTRYITTADPAAGSEVADVSPPTGTLWLIRTYTVQLVQGLTQTPLPALEFEDFTPLQIAVIPAMTTALGASTTAQLTWGIGLVQTSFVAVAGDEMYTAPLPIIYLTASQVVATLTDGIGANTNYGPAFLCVEEWVMPN